jgi:hypothetical protein
MPGVNAEDADALMMIDLTRSACSIAHRHHHHQGHAEPVSATSYLLTMP